MLAFVSNSDPLALPKGLVDLQTYGVESAAPLVNGVGFASGASSSVQKVRTCLRVTHYWH
jgi:hypothetical protein